MCELFTWLLLSLIISHLLLNLQIEIGLLTPIKQSNWNLNHEIGTDFEP